MNKKTLIIILTSVFSAVIVAAAAVLIWYSLRPLTLYEDKEADSMHFVYSERDGWAFIGSYDFDYDDSGEPSASELNERIDAAKEFTIPDYVPGTDIPITSLGGKRGHEGTVPFCVNIPDKYVERYNFNVSGGTPTGEWGYFTEEQCEERNISYSSYTSLTFTVNVGRFVNRIETDLGKRYIGVYYTDADGNEQVKIAYKIRYSFIVDKSNRTFSGNGTLYWKDSSTSLSDLFFF